MSGTSRRRSIRVAGLLAICLLPGMVSGCSAPAGSPRAGTAQLTVYAAASLRDAVTASVAAYREMHPAVQVVTSFDASSALRVQIEQGAPADLFLSADTETADELAADGLGDGRPVPFARNRLVIVVPDANPAGIRGWQDLAREGVRVVAAASAVPIQRYADALLAALAALPTAPADYRRRVTANIVSREDNVRAVLARIEVGEGDAGVVYATDAATSSRVRTIAVPDAVNPTATYAGVVVAGSAHADAARAFLDWLRSSSGRAVLARFGFLAP